MDPIARRAPSVIAVKDFARAAGRRHGTGGGWAIRPPIPGWDWTRIEDAVAVLCGCGAIGGPLAGGLASLGFINFILSDPKIFRSASVASQCEPWEVGRRKVEAVGARLRRLGASALPFPAGIEDLQPGCAGPQSLVILSADKLAGEQAANRFALAIRRPLVKVHVEPLFLTASFRFFDYTRHPIRACLECLFGASDHHRLQKERSCDGSRERATGSPRALTQATAGFAAQLIASAMADPGAWELLDGREYLLTALGPRWIDVEHSRNPNCPACSGERPGTVEWLSVGPEAVSFEMLADRGGFSATERLGVGGSGRLVRRVRCGRCFKQRPGWWWASLSGRPVGRCSHCGGGLHPMPLFTQECAGSALLGPAWGAPLASIGVKRQAAVALRTAHRQAAFVLGCTAAFSPPAACDRKESR